MRLIALRSFPNRYLFSLYHKVTSSLSIRYILRIIFRCDCSPFARLKSPNYKTGRFFQWSGVDLPLWLELFGRCVFVDIIRNDATFCGAPFPLFHIGV